MSARSEDAHVECNDILQLVGETNMPIGIALPPAGSLARGVACPKFWLGRCMYGNDSGVYAPFFPSLLEMPNHVVASWPLTPRERVSSCSLPRWKDSRVIVLNIYCNDAYCARRAACLCKSGCRIY